MKRITFVGNIRHSGRKDGGNSIIGIPKAIVTVLKLKRGMLINATIGDLTLCKKLYQSGGRNTLVMGIPSNMVEYLRMIRNSPLVPITIEKVETSLLERILS